MAIVSQALLKLLYSIPSTSEKSFSLFCYAMSFEKLAAISLWYMKRDRIICRHTRSLVLLCSLEAHVIPVRYLRLSSFFLIVD